MGKRMRIRKHSTVVELTSFLIAMFTFTFDNISPLKLIAATVLFYSILKLSEGDAYENKRI